MLSGSKVTNKMLVLAMALFGVMSIAASTTFASSIKKSFEFGAGTANSHSNFRTFAVPCGLDVTASVTYSRKGDTGANNDIPIFIELRQPGETDSVDGPVAVKNDDLVATRTVQTASVSGQKSNRGCSLPWRVRVGYRNPGEAPFAVYGDITVSFNDSSRNINVEGGLISLNKGTDVTKKLGGSSGLGQGIIEITANWQHALGPVPVPGAVKLKFELIDPNGNVVETESGFSSNDFTVSASQKFKLTYRVTSCTSGQWKIRITNNTDDDTMNIDPKVTFKPDCP